MVEDNEKDEMLMYENRPKYDRVIASVFTKRCWYVVAVT